MGTEEQPRKTKRGYIGCLGLIIILGIIGAIFGPKKTQEEVEREEASKRARAEERASQEEQQQAYYMAKQFITNRLKAPSTAKFPSPYDRNESGITTVQLPGGAYRVSAWVDAQNAFGAMLRKRWVCEVKPSQKSGYWEVAGLCTLIE
jgi:hypothetical protein